MATIVDSFLVLLESKAKTEGFDIFDNLSKRLVITLGDVINIAERGAQALGNLFKPALDADVIAAKIQGFGYDVDKTWQTLLDMSLKMGTPFEEALDGFTKLKSYGVDPLNGALQTLKTITSATGGDLKRTIVAYGQAMAMGSLQGQEKNQFINAGVDIWGALTRFTGKKLGELQDMMSKRQVTADMLSKALLQEAARLQPIADKVAHTLRAQLTNLTTLWYTARARLSRTRLWQALTDGAISAIQTITAVINDQSLKQAFDGLDRLIFGTIQNIEHLYSVVTDNFPAMVAIASLALWALLPVVTKVVSGILVQLARLTVALLTNPVYLMIAAIAALVAVLVDLDDAAAGRDTVGNWSKEAIENWKIVKQYILVIADAIKSLFDGRAWNALSEWWDSFMAKVKAGIESLKLWLTEAISQLPGGQMLLNFFSSDKAKKISNSVIPDDDQLERARNFAGKYEPGPSIVDRLWDFGGKFNPIWGSLTPGGMAMQNTLDAARTANDNSRPQEITINNDNSAVVHANITESQNAAETGREITNQVADHQASATVQANSKTAVKQ